MTQFGFETPQSGLAARQIVAAFRRKSITLETVRQKHLFLADEKHSSPYSRERSYRPAYMGIFGGEAVSEKPVVWHCRE
jgi:hypothetical protein